MSYAASVARAPPSEWPAGTSNAFSPHAKGVQLETFGKVILGLDTHVVWCNAAARADRSRSTAKPATTCHEDAHIPVLVLEARDDLADAVHHLITEAAGHPAPEEALHSGKPTVKTLPAVHLISAVWWCIQMACNSAARQVTIEAGPGAQMVVLSPTTCRVRGDAPHTKPAFDHASMLH